MAWVSRLRAALAGLGGDARITVAELVPAIVEWARGPMAGLTGGCLDDARVSISEGDVGEVIASARGAFDAILLDVDNGPDGLSRSGNDRLYDMRGLEAARKAFGRTACWRYGRRRRTGNSPVVWSARALMSRKSKPAPTSGRGVRHIIWTAKT